MNESNMVKIREDSLKVTLDSKDITKSVRLLTTTVKMDSRSRPVKI